MTRLEEIEARKLEIRSEVEATEDLEKIEELNQEVDSLDEEVKEINEQKEQRKIGEQLEKKEVAAKEVSIEEKSIGGNIMETRNTKEYINAFASYVKEGLVKDYTMSAEERALLTNNATDGVVAVPDMVDDIIKTAWEREDLMARVRTLSVKGNLKVQFEVSGDAAVKHQEGYGAVTEESLVLGVVELPAKSIKKWISISDEVLDMRGEEFLRYIYDELTYRIAKKCADKLVGIIKALPTSLTKVSAYNLNNKIFPIVERYTCTEQEKQALINKIEYDGMTIMKIDNLSNYSTTSDFDYAFIRGDIIRLPINGDSHMANEIYNEVKKGLHISRFAN